MQTGSLVELKKDPIPEDYVRSLFYGIKLPMKGVIYVIADGPIPRNFNGFMLPGIQLEELPGHYYNADFFKEVQPPIDVEAVILEEEAA